MVFLTSWIPVLTTFLLLLHFWRAKVSASGTSEEEVIDPKYVIIGVTLGVFLAIGFLALKICMIKRQLIDNDFVDSDNRVDKRYLLPLLGPVALPVRLVRYSLLLSHVESAAMREEVNP
ncbi:transmembrane protein 273 isoform X1 [Mauremys reevesii]|uniref:transmembrane protein 273 isoform X1 n=1 Tax=Mauremys reevesii TaxID=260615 RepID=UPI00193F19A6|nr:transmembrane protein 273 isoform X1 [Mauremys reevesii]